MSRLAEFATAIMVYGKSPSRKTSPRHTIRKPLRGAPIVDSFTPTNVESVQAQ